MEEPTKEEWQSAFAIKKIIPMGKGKMGNIKYITINYIDTKTSVQVKREK